MKMNILIVDDDETLRKELSEWLVGEGYKTKLAGSGEEAVEIVKNQDFNLIFTDLKMPGMNGIDVVRAIKKLKPSAHMVMITAFGTIDTAVEAMKTGADDFITKPFQMKQLQSVIDNVAKTIEFEKKIDRIEVSEKPESKNPYEHFGSLVGDSKGLCITTENPQTIREKYGLRDTLMIWLTSDHAGTSCIHPQDIYKVKHTITHYFAHNPKGVVLMDGLEVLIKQHSWEIVKRVVFKASNSALLGQSSLIVSIKPDQVDAGIMAELKYLISNPYIQLISGSLSSLIRRSIVKHLSIHGSSRFTDILNGLKLESAPKLSFHLVKMLNDGIIQKDGEKIYTLTNRGKSATEYLARLEDEAVSDVRNNISLILNSE
ncbi:MAG: response regulator [Thermoplasmata archaeon]|nr:response regulator [Thermoplasmata archaeon]